MNLGDLVGELNLIVRDSYLAQQFEKWINSALLELATDLDLPALRKLEPTPLTVDTSTWIFDAPTDYHKKLFRATDSEGQNIRIFYRVEDLEALDMDHDVAGDHVTSIAMHDMGYHVKVCVYPKADETINLWYYEKPETLSSHDDIVKCLPPGCTSRVIVPKVVLKNFKMLQDLMTEAPHQSFGFWIEEQKIGLYGSNRGEIGLVNLLALRKKPVRHGGRDSIR